MDGKIETEIAQFFQKRVRERVAYELSSKKRADFFDKIAHSAEDYIDARYIAEKSESPLPREYLAEKLGKTCYVAARSSVLDGTMTDTRTALSELWSCGVPYLLYGNGFLYLETEYDFSAHRSYLLRRQ
ncbi:MAG: hypothetical protein NC299_06920 [Lachnospiraceae bacterium]|nr:hypothetical protein [Ruminococcus sp.]MCM1275086.1 hypothetical protein [Lachnospiraceae bacterium]